MKSGLVKERAVKKGKQSVKGHTIFKLESSSDSFVHGSRMPELIKDECLFELFEETARQYPDNKAVIYEGEYITYKDLNAMANKIGWMLREKGVVKEDRIAVFMSKSYECYAAILGIMKAGACYIPLDPGYPEDRVKYIVEDSFAKYVLVSDGKEKGFYLKNTIAINRNMLGKYQGANISRETSGVGKDSLAYIIYTSGSTGRPKGVMIEHKSACNLVRTSQEIYKVTEKDIVYQGFTLAFDASVEELWMAFFNGAALLAQDEKMRKSGSDLFKLLSEFKVSIVSCVPTLLSIINDDIPTLRLLILGGEACPEAVVKKFKKPGRRILNTYGPTEASVIATWSEMKLDKKVTIGKPLPNYSVYVVKEDGELAKVGEAGELLIGGIGLARGYVGREDLNKEKFIENTFCDDPYAQKRLYRSGDLVALDEEGDLEFHGRIDDQVKIRGFRIELSEIENVANSFSQVEASVVKVHKFDDGSDAICLYSVPVDKASGIDSESLFYLMKERLPSYMMPQHFMIIDEIPILASGKADRKKLPLPSGGGFSNNKKIIAPTSKLEEKIVEVYSQVFKMDNISVTDHFFNDLGGHSLYVAQAVSMLRKEKEFQSLNISDLYETPTIQELALKFDKKDVTNAKRKRKKMKTFTETSSRAHKICGLFQALSIFVVTLLICIPAGYIVYSIFSGYFSLKEVLIALSVFGILYNPVTLILAVASKWLLIGRYKEGSYPLWGFYYFRWWLARLFQRMYPEHLISGTPLMPLYLRLMGAKVGKDCYIGTHHFGAFDLISFGDNTSIAQDTQVLGYSIEHGCINFGKITVGKNCYIGTHSTLCINSSMSDGSMIKEQSMVPSDVNIPKGEFWAGSPAKRDERDEDIIKLSGMENGVGRAKKIVTSLLHTLVLALFGLVSALIMSQGFVFGYLYYKSPSWMILISPLTASLIVLATCLEIILLKRLFMNRMKPGVYSIYSTYYVRKWAADNIMYISLQMLHTLYATLYTVPFLRALGAKIGKRVEVSTVTHISPELFEVGDGSFFADASMAGTPKVYNNSVMYEGIKVGSGTFIGNSALVPINTTIGDDCLIGVMSIPPSNRKTENGTSWLGTPAMFLHKRDVNKEFSDKTTYNPGTLLYIKRLAIEFIRVILPTNIYVLVSYVIAYIFHYFAVNFYFWQTVLLMSVTAVVFEAALILFVALLKFSVIGTYRPCVNPLWSNFVWKTEFITGIYENLLGDHILTPLTGTPLLPIVMRLFGCRIGKRVFLDTIFISEFDLVKIGREAAVNYNSTMQTHLFEDRVLKMDYLTIGNRASVGNGAVILYDTYMEEGSKLGSSSLLMKGETLESYTHWHGNPSSMAM